MVEVDLTQDTPDYVVNARWVLEGILLPAIGGLGIGGMVWELGIISGSDYQEVHL
jgi:hypothetical protein